MQAADAEALQLVRAEPLGLGLGRARLPRLRLLDHRTDDVRLPALVEQAAEPRVRLELRSCVIQLVTIGLRFAGGFAISLTARSP